MKQDIRNISVELGKIPPQAIEIEEAIIGALMLQPDSINEIVDLITSETFYKPSHQKLYNSILELHNKNENIDLLTVMEQLRVLGTLDEIGGVMYLTKLTSKVASSAHIVNHAQIISQKYLARELIRVSSEIQIRAFDESEDIDDLLSFSEVNIFSISQSITKKEPLSLRKSLPITYESIKIAKQKKENNEFTGVASGLTDLDRITGGWQPTDLIIVAARPSMGKTAIALHFCKMAALFNTKVLMFSLEMSTDQLNTRLISSETTYTSTELRNGTINELDSIMKACGTLANLGVNVDDTAGIDILELKAKSRRIKAKENIGLIIVDYLQLIRSKEYKNNREQEVSYISRSLKSLAKEIDVPIIALSQLNRSVETRGGDKRPQMSDLRESGAIEQDADMVCFIHRPEYYKIGEIEINGEYVNSSNLGMILIGKHRNGALGEVVFKHSNGMTHFESYKNEIQQYDYNSDNFIEPNTNFDNEQF